MTSLDNIIGVLLSFIHACFCVAFTIGLILTSSIVDQAVLFIGIVFFAYQATEIALAVRRNIKQGL